MPEVAVPPIAVPSMIVVEPAAVAIPITFEELSSLIARTYPMRSAVGRTGPISVMPPVPSSNRIPVTVYPEVIRPGGSRTHPDDARRRRRANPYADRHLRETCPPSQEQ